MRNQSSPLLETKVEGQVSRGISEPGGDRHRLGGSNGMMACLPLGTFKLRGDFSVFRIPLWLLCASVEERAGGGAPPPLGGSALRTHRCHLSSSPEVPNNTGEQGCRSHYFLQKKN